MLHQGQWEDMQIVSPGWVTRNNQTAKENGPRGDNYGYGWWVPPSTQFIEFAAEGRGGQYIRVLPQLNMVIVTTGGGFEWDDITPMLVPVTGKYGGAPAANPPGGEQLDKSVTNILQPPPLQAVPPFLRLHASISGNPYAFAFSPLDIKTICFNFDNSTEAQLHATFYNQPDQDLLIPLDGVYEMYPIGEHGLLMGLRGSWVDDQTFLFEYDEIASNDAYALEIHFEGDHITIDARERTHTGILTLEGTLLSP